MNQDGHFSLVLIAIFLSSTGLCYAGSNTEPEHIVLMRLNDTQLDFYIKHPEGIEEGEKVGLLILMQGSGCGTAQRAFAWGDKANTKGKKKVAEKVGVHAGDTGKDCSDEYDQHNTLPLRVFDYSQILLRLRKTATWWDQELYILGGSEGGALAAIIAGFAPETKKVVIFISGGGLTLVEMQKRLAERTMRQEGSSEIEIGAALQDMEDRFRHVRTNPSPKNPTDSDAGSDTTKSFESMMDIRALNVLVDITIPIYMLAGTEDINDSVESSRITANTFKALGKDNLVYHEYPGLDHSLSDSKGKSRMRELLADSIEWLLAN
jgi:hypothetical protein